MPDKTATLGFAPCFGLIGTANFPKDALGCGDLVGAHDQQRIVDVKNGIAQQNLQQCILLKECGSKIL